MDAMAKEYENHSTNLVRLPRTPKENVPGQLSDLMTSLKHLLAEQERLLQLQLKSVGSDVRKATVMGSLALPFSTAGLVLLSLSVALAWSGQGAQDLATGVSFLTAAAIVGAVLLAVAIILMVLSAVSMSRIRRTVTEIQEDIRLDFQLQDY